MLASRFGEVGGCLRDFLREVERMTFRESEAPNRTQGVSKRILCERGVRRTQGTSADRSAGGSHPDLFRCMCARSAACFSGG